MLKNCVLLLLGLAVLAACQTSEPLVAYDGAALYQDHCALCHGASARGDGPYTRHLNLAVPNLRDTKVRNELEFVQIIDGRASREGHGLRSMPIWGWAFREGEWDETQVQARLQALASYLVSIQSSAADSTE